MLYEVITISAFGAGSDQVHVAVELVAGVEQGIEGVRNNFV